MNSYRKSLGKKDRLCSVKAITALFAGGRSFHVPPLRVVYIIADTEEPPHPRILISVPKRNLRRAVDRNLLRRRIREAWRLNCTPLREALLPENKGADIALIYTDTAIQPFGVIERSIKEITDRLTHLK